MKKIKSLKRQHGRLAHLPVSFFSVVMGLTGLAIAVQKVVEINVLPGWLFALTLALSTFVFVLLLIVYGAKTIMYPTFVREEFRHPIRLNFFPAIAISFLLQSIAYYAISPTLSGWLWVVGAVSQLVFTVIIVGEWVWRKPASVESLNPAWFIPAVGNIVVPIVGVHHAHHDISVIFFALGIFFWVLLTASFFFRSIFYSPLPAKFMPTLFILISPPAIGVVALYKLNGTVDGVTTMLYGIGVFTLLVLLSRARTFLAVPFALTWWAYTFPLAAITIASSVMYKVTHQSIYIVLTAVLLGLTTMVVAVTLYKTAIAIKRKLICLPEA